MVRVDMFTLQMEQFPASIFLFFVHSSELSETFMVQGSLVLRNFSNLKKICIYTDIGKTFGLLPDRRTGNHMENPSFTSPPKLFQDLFFFNIRIPIEGLFTGIFFTGREDRHNKGFHRSSTVFTGRGPRTGGFPDVCVYILIKISLKFVPEAPFDYNWFISL